MKGLEVYVSTDYSTGPGPRVVLNIDCDEFDMSYTDEEPDAKIEFINTLKEPFSEIAKFNSKSASVVLSNYKLEHYVHTYTAMDGNEYSYDTDTFNIPLDMIFDILYENFEVSNIWTHLDKDFHELLSTGEFSDCLSNWHCKAEKYFVCGEYKQEFSEFWLPGQVLEKFPVKPAYRRSFNQRIWKANRHIHRDVTSQFDTVYKRWKNEYETREN
ncbi:MAG: hypothetical protein IKT74_03685 [Bacteroidales bacterium]|nr:hypothetical protein [Bacteroidales bacterium]